MCNVQLQQSGNGIGHMRFQTVQESQQYSIPFGSSTTLHHVFALQSRLTDIFVVCGLGVEGQQEGLRQVPYFFLFVRLDHTGSLPL